MAFQDKLKPVAQGGFQNKLKPISTAKPTFDVPETSAARENRIAKFEAEQKTYDTEAGKGFFGRFGKALVNNLIPSEIGLGKTIASTLLQGSATNQALQGSIADASTSQMQLLKQIRENEAKGMDTTKLKQLYNEQEAQMKETTGKARSFVQLPTNVQAAGQIGGTALDLLTAGSFSKASRALPTGRLGNLASSRAKTVATTTGLPELGAIAGQKAKGFFSFRGAGNIAQGFGLGYASDVAAGAQGLRGEENEGVGAFVPGAGALIGTTLPALSEIGQTISNIRNPEPRIITKRGETLNTITKKYSKVDKAVKNAQDNGVDAIKVLSESNVLNGAVDDDGLLAADRALANFDEFMAPYEGEVRKVIQEEGRTVNISQLAGNAEEFVKNSRLPGAAKDQLRAALESDMRGFLIDGDMIPVETLHDTKIFRASHSNYADTGATAVSKEAARFFKEQVEKNVSSLKVKEYNNALSKYYSIRDVIESLNRTRVQGGRLGKYFSSVIGTGVGGMAGGPIGAIIGAEAGARIQGNMMSRALGGNVSKGLDVSPELISASQRVTGKAAIPDVVIPPRANKGIPDVVMGQSNKVGSRQTSQATTMIPVTTAPKSAIKKSLPQTVTGSKSGKLPDSFERAPNLSPANRKIETAAFNKIAKNEQALLDEYKNIPETKGGQVINTDLFRRVFKNEGYAGHNAAAVQEPSSYLSKKAFTEALKNPGETVIMTAGGSGTGKSSALAGISSVSKEMEGAAAILDSNLSSYKSAIKKIEEAEKAGKDIVIEYVYRDPEDSFEYGVVKRMLTNKEEGGRLVPSKVVAANHIDSLEVVKRLQDEGYSVTFVDNSNGPGKQAISTYEEINKKANYPTKEELTNKFNQIAKKLYENGTITKEQYEGYIE